MSSWIDVLKETGINDYYDLLKDFKKITENLDDTELSNSNKESVIKEIKAIINLMNDIIEYLKLKSSVDDRGKRVFPLNVKNILDDNELLTFFGSLDIIDFDKKIRESRKLLEKLTTINDNWEISYKNN